MPDIYKFIEEHLSQNCVKMTEHLHNSPYLAEMAYLMCDEQFRSSKRLTVRVKALEYYSCMRMFDVCHFLIRDISKILHDSKKDQENTPNIHTIQSVGSFLLSTFRRDQPGFENERIEAEYYLLRGIQYRSYEPVHNFDTSEASFKHSISIYNKLIEAGANKPSQSDVDERFRAQMNLLSLYVNADEYDMAAELINEIDEELLKTRISENAYLSVYYYVNGLYQLKMHDHVKAINLLEKAEKYLEATPESVWAGNGVYEKLITSKLQEANNHLQPNAVVRFFKRLQQPQRMTGSTPACAHIPSA